MDPLLSLAMSIHDAKGVYALLLGSGISRAAAIPTGWEIVLDLIERVARLAGESTNGDPARWYEGKYKEPPRYDILLKLLARTSAERQLLLRRYFEPTDEERDAGQKVPTLAHRSIAALVKSGHVRVIVTTNFDRLIEQSLEALGISPTVVTNASDAQGALPLVHLQSLVVKLHGDYRDVRFKNTTAELGKYAPPMRRLLARVLDEYGLIVCGWSGEWDAALCEEIRACRSRRFTTFWGTRGPLADNAKVLVQRRDASVVPIEDADAFFKAVAEKVASLESIEANHPLSAAVAVATLKRYMVDPQRRIDLHDLFNRECDRVVSGTTDARMPTSGTVPLTPQNAVDRVKAYETVSSILVHLIATGCYWSEREQTDLWLRAVLRLVDRETLGGYVVWNTLRRYPALLAFYAGGIGAMVGGRYETLAALLLTKATIAENAGPEVLVSGLSTDAVLDRGYANEMFGQGQGKAKTPVSDHLAQVLREPLATLIPDAQRFERAFDRFEFFCACVELDLGRRWFHRGRFIWHDGVSGYSFCAAATALIAEAKEEGASWGPLRAGFFQSSPQRFQAAAEEVKRTSLQIM